MKWFKHMTDAGDDEKLLLLFDEHGHKGLSVWWLVMERVCRKVEKNNPSPKVTMSIQNWRKVTRVGPKMVRKLFQFMSDIELMSVSFENNMATVEIYKILETIDKNLVRNVKTTTQELESELESKSEPDIKKEEPPFRDGMYVPLKKGVRLPKAPSHEETVELIWFPDGPHYIYKSQLDDWTKTFPNISPGYEVAQLARLWEEVYDRDGWTDKQRQSWTGRSMCTIIYSILKKNQAKMVAQAPIQQAQPEPEDKRLPMKPPNYYMFDAETKAKWDKQHGYA